MIKQLQLKINLGLVLWVMWMAVNGQHVGIGTATPSGYGHGGTNRILELYNPGFTTDAQSHLILSNSSVSGSLGTITWASRAITIPEQRVAVLVGSFDNATANNPRTAMRFWVHSGSQLAERMTILGNGNVGIGHSAPNGMLQLNNAIINRKIVLYEGSNNDHQFYGFGINGGLLRYQTDAAEADHVFFAATSASSSRELMRVKGNGNVGIGTAPAVRLDVGGTDGWDLVNGEGDFRIGNSSNRLKMGVALGGGGVGASGIMQSGGVGVLSIGAASKYLLQLNGSGFVDLQNNTGGLRINGNAGAAGQVLRSGGPGAAPAWTNADNAFYFFRCPDSQVEFLGVNSSGILGINGIDGNTITVTRPSAVIVSCKVTPFNPQNTFGGIAIAMLRTSLMSGATNLGYDGAYAKFGDGEMTTMVTNFVVDNVPPGNYTISANFQKGYGDEIGYGSVYQANWTNAATMVVQVIPK